MSIIIQEAIANITSTTEALDKFCNAPENYNSYMSQVLEHTIWELVRQANELKDFQNRYGV